MRKNVVNYRLPIMSCFVAVGFILMMFACQKKSESQMSPELAQKIVQDERLDVVSQKAEGLLKSELNAGDSYNEVWIRDLNTFIELACKVGDVSKIKESLLIFFKFQGEDGNIVDGYVKTAEARIPYNFYYSELAPDFAAHKNTVETDQESSLIQAVFKYIEVTGDRSILQEQIAGRSVEQRMEDALKFLLNERYDEKHGLLWGATTADWGDVQPEHEWGVEMDSTSHLSIDIYDNAMFVIAIKDFIDMSENVDKKYWEDCAGQISKNVRKHLWDDKNQKFIPHIYLNGSPFPDDFDENQIYYHGGTAIAIEAGLLTHDEILHAYNRMQENVKAAEAQSIGLTMYPPYPKGLFKNTWFIPYYYQNGGDWTWFGGRMVQQLIVNGFYQEAYDAISPMLDRVIEHNGFYEWWTPEGKPHSGNFRGSAGVLWTAIQMFYNLDEVQKMKQPVDYVNPFIGASTAPDRSGYGLGKTFPGVATPFGMTQVSPNTITGGDNGSGYSYEHTSIEGFAFTQMSGVGWYGDLGNFLVMPTTGPLKTVAGKPDNTSEGYRSNYSKESEKTSAGYYSAQLTDYSILAEATASPHGGILRFTFPENKQSRIQIDLARRVGGTSVSQYVKVVDKNTIRGWMKCTPEGGGWGNGDGHPDYTVYFYAEFSKPLENYGFWSADIPDDWSRKLGDVTSDRYLQRVAQSKIIKNVDELEGKHIGFFSEFETKAGEEVVLKAGISFVDMEDAEKNFKTELASASFDGIKDSTHKLWNKALEKVSVSGGTEEDRVVFYTSLYHTMIDPRDFADVDGRYIGGDKKIYDTDKYTRRTIFSGWDVFRSQFPLQTIIDPDLVNDMINSFISLAEENGTGYYDRWEFLNAYSGCMIGNPAISVIADAYVKGIRDYDVEKAYRYSVNTSDKFGNGTRGFSTDYSISSTLEYAYFDWCVSVLAENLGKADDAKLFREKGRAYRNVFDPEVNWFRPKLADGSWEALPENFRIKEWYGSIESNPYQQGWFVPHDVPGMVELMGGVDKVLPDLIEFFEKAPLDLCWNDYYNHANEPVHHVPFLFNRLNAPWLTQYWTRHICRNAYKNKVEGLVGNEDVGQMSAWYILAASGIHPVCPGETRYEITSPVFNEITFNPASEKPFVVVAHNNSSQNIYIQKAKLNGKKYNKCFIDHSDIMKGGKLELFMGPEANKKWGVE